VRGRVVEEVGKINTMLSEDSDEMPGFGASPFG
jgi:hypothetical protein